MMKNKSPCLRYFASFVCLFLALGAFGSLNGSGAEVSGLGKGPGNGKSLVKGPIEYKGEKTRFAVFYPSAAKEIIAIEKYYKSAYREAEVEFVRTGSHPDDQLYRILILVAAGDAQAVIVAPVNAHVMSSVYEALDGVGVPVVSLGGNPADAVANPLYCNVVYDKKQAGKAIGRYVAQKLDKKGQVVLFEHKNASEIDGNSFKKGVRSAFSDYSGIKMIDEIQTVNNADTVADITVQVFAEHYPDSFPQAFVCEGSYMALGVCKGFTERLGLVPDNITSIGNSSAVLEKIRYGDISATMWEDYQSLARTAVDAAVAMSLDLEVAPSYKIPYHLVTAENINLYYNK